MNLPNIKRWALCLLITTPMLGMAQQVKVITTHVGYEDNRAKHAIIEASHKLSIPTFSLINTAVGIVVYSGKPAFSGGVDRWKNWQFWTIDFSGFTTDGTYQLRIALPGGAVSSYPFVIGKNVLEQATLSNVTYY